MPWVVSAVSGVEDSAAVAATSLSEPVPPPAPSPPPPLTDVVSSYQNEMKQAQGYSHAVRWVTPLLVFLSLTGCCVWWVTTRRPLHHASKEVAEVVAANPGALDSQGAIAIIDETLIEESQRKLRRPTPRPYV